MINNVTDFISSYFTSDEYFFVTMIDIDTKITTNYLHNIESFKHRVGQFKAYNSTKSIYFTLNSFKAPNKCFLSQKGYPRKIKDNVSSIKALIFDFDEPSVSKECLNNLLTSLNLTPTYLVQTSKDKFQVCFKLKTENINITEYEIINKTIATYFKSDTNVCSVEKLFRLPFFVNKKNGFSVELMNYDFSKVYDFKYFQDFVLNNASMKEIYEDLKSKLFLAKPKVIKKSHTLKRLEEEIESNIATNVDSKFIKRYRYLLKVNKDDASVTDITYLKSRKKETDNFEIVWGEILYLRELCDKPIKRDIRAYKIDRENLFFR